MDAILAPSRVSFSSSVDGFRDQYSSPSGDGLGTVCSDWPVTAPCQFTVGPPSPQPTRKYCAHNSPAKPRIAHPYARLFAKKKNDTKRRRIWNHLLEKSIFSPYELSTLGAQPRRKIYTASLEAHIDELHARLLDLNCDPINPAELEPFRGLNSKTAKSTVSSLQHEVSVARLKLLELERANAELECLLRARTHSSPIKSCESS